METETVQLLLNAAAGPASGVVVAMICLGGFGLFLIKFLLPQQERQLDKVLKDSAEDRKLFEKSVNVVVRRLDKIEDAVANIQSRI
jgi:LPS sulfotransferase NodH